MREAVALHDAGRFEEALAAFKKAWALRPNARVQRGIALVLFELREYAAALAELERALASKIEPLPDELRQQLLDVRARLHSEVTLLRVRATPWHARLRVDGEQVSPEEWQQIVLSPGPHLLELFVDGAPPLFRTVIGHRGEQQELTLEITPLVPAKEAHLSRQPVESPVPQVPPSTGVSSLGVAPTERPHRVWQDYTLGGVMVAVGAVVLIPPSASLARRRGCANNDCTAIYIRHELDGRGWAMLVAGIALVGSGVGIMLLGPFGKRATLGTASLGPGTLQLSAAF